MKLYKGMKSSAKERKSLFVENGRNKEIFCYCKALEASKYRSRNMVTQHVALWRGVTARQMINARHRILSLSAIYQYLHEIIGRNVQYNKSSERPMIKTSRWQMAKRNESCKEAVDFAGIVMACRSSEMRHLAKWCRADLGANCCGLSANSSRRIGERGKNIVSSMLFAIIISLGGEKWRRRGELYWKLGP